MKYILLSILLIFLTSCSIPVEENEISLIEIEPSATTTITASPTIVWFPPTATATRLPTQQPFPTPQEKPPLQEIILQDDFSNTTLWEVSRSESGSVAYGRNELTIAISKPGGVLSSLADASLPVQHYLEININPSLCRGEDSYGLLFRVRNPEEYYRLSINCMGQIKLDQIRRGSVTALTGWISSGQVLPGPLFELKLGIWSGENALSIYINDVQQFTISHPAYRGEGLGIFAHSGGENALTVNFNNLVVYSIDSEPTIPQPTATPTRRPTKTPYIR